MPSRITALILLTATVTACAPGQTSLFPHPEPVAEGAAFTFKEWLPDGVPSFLEGQVAVTTHGLQVTTRQARCHELPSPPDRVQRDFNCGGVILSFSRDDPTLQATFRYSAMIPQNSSQCGTALIHGAGGARLCPSSRVSTSYRRVERTGRLQLTLIE
ncbi:MAG TPA: hypothetical protein VMK53_02130 [Gemmatimonadales bacterium]|nr:hypothetical protein [Gemmatimonadales bacterium]